MIRKWRTWVVSAPLVAGFLWLGAPGAALLAAGLGAVGAVEYGRLARLRTADSWLVAAAAVALPLVAWRAPARLGHVFAAALLAVALVPVLGGDAADGRAAGRGRGVRDRLARGADRAGAAARGRAAADLRGVRGRRRRMVRRAAGRRARAVAAVAR